jgi:hypothetical protein
MPSRKPSPRQSEKPPADDSEPVAVETEAKEPVDGDGARM